jgi:hypothetical protein
MLGRKRRKRTKIILRRNMDVGIRTGERQYQGVNRGGCGKIHANWFGRRRIVI